MYLTPVVLTFGSPSFVLIRQDSPSQTGKEDQFLSQHKRQPFIQLHDALLKPGNLTCSCLNLRDDAFLLYRKKINKKQPTKKAPT